MPKKEIPTAEYSVEKELTEVVEDLLQKLEYSEFKDIRDEEIVVLPCFVIRTDKDGNTRPSKGPPVKIKKVGELERVFMQDKPHYLLVMDYATWENVQDRERLAMLHEGLMQVNIEYKDNGAIKLGKRKHDVVAFQATIKRFGPWTDVLQSVREAFKQNPGRFLPRTEPEETPEEVPDERRQESEEVSE